MGLGILLSMYYNPILANFNVFRYGVKVMEEAGNGGSVVNVSSLAGLGGITGKMGVGHYGVSKWAVNGMTQIAALEYIPAKIRVNAVCPTSIETDLVKSFIENSEDKQASIAMIGSTNPMVGPGVSKRHC